MKSPGLNSSELPTMIPTFVFVFELVTSTLTVRPPRTDCCDRHCPRGGGCRVSGSSCVEATGSSALPEEIVVVKESRSSKRKQPKIFANTKPDGTNGTSLPVLKFP